jgi:molybdopterin synthase catalytic subunit/predicted GIY-YIG superfamily endonuclease
MPGYLYVLRCSDGSLYIGSTNDIERRYEQHVTRRGARYTKSHDVVEPAAVAVYDSLREARSAEAFAKQMSKAEREAFVLSLSSPTSSSIRTDAPSVDRCIDAVKHAGAGAVVVMLGMVRNHAIHDAVSVSVVSLRYEAFAAMAEKTISDIVDRAQKEIVGVRVSVEHRVGDLTVGDVAVVVAASAPHRKEAFTACQFTIDELKQHAPIWKKEFGSDGVVWVGTGP